MKIIISLVCFMLLSFSSFANTVDTNTINTKDNPDIVFTEDIGYKPLIVIDYDGKVTLSEGLKLDEASRLFWEDISKQFPILLAEKDAKIKELENKIKELELQPSYYLDVAPDSINPFIYENEIKN